MKNKKILLGIIFLGIIILISSSVLADMLTELYNEDYSFRSGLELENKLIDNHGNLLQKSFNYWNTRYPFRDPNKFNADEGKIIKDNIGFKYSILRTQLDPTDLNQIEGGKLEQNLAVIPFLEAKKTISYDLQTGDTLGNGVLYEYDKFGNIKKESNFGVMEDLYDNFERQEVKTFERFFLDKQIRDPNVEAHLYPLNSRPDLVKSTQYTTLQGAISSVDSRRVDNVYTETEYYYDAFPVYKMDDNYPSEGRIRATSDIRANYQLLNWVDLPYKIIVKDEIGRKISNVEYNFLTYAGGFDSCGAQNRIENFLCDAHSIYGSCTTMIVSQDGQAVIGCGDTDEVNVCFRRALSYTLTKPELANGFDERFAGGGELSKVDAFGYDECGNIREVGNSQAYMDAAQDINENPIYNTISFESNKVLLEYEDTYYANPEKVEVRPVYQEHSDDYNSLSVTRTAKTQGYGYITQSENENGLITNYGYDALGRIKGVHIDEDGDLTRIDYDYEQYNSIELGYVALRIKETREIGYNKYIISYHLYDGAGSYIQTQTLNDKETSDESDDEIIISLTEYDILGRVKSAIKPVARLRSSISFGEYTIPSGTDVFRMEYEYDALNRVTKIINYDMTEINKKYYINTSYGSQLETFNIESATDEEGRERTYYSDSRGNLVSVKLPSLEEGD